MSTRLADVTVGELLSFVGGFAVAVLIVAVMVGVGWLLAGWLLDKARDALDRYA